jgi:hypothetical protein
VLEVIRFILYVEDGSLSQKQLWITVLDCDFREGEAVRAVLMVNVAAVSHTHAHSTHRVASTKVFVKTEYQYYASLSFKCDAMCSLVDTY